MTIDHAANFRAFKRRQRIDRIETWVVALYALFALAAVPWAIYRAFRAPNAGGGSPPAPRSPTLPPGPVGGHRPYSLDVPAFSEEAGVRPSLASMTVHAASRGVSARQGWPTATGNSGEFPASGRPCHLILHTDGAAGDVTRGRGKACERGHGVEHRNGPMPAGRMFRVTAYCPCKICCGRNAKGITASGKPAVGKIVAADWRVLPKGTIIDVPGYGRATVLDTGSAIKGHRLDVLFPTHQEAREWGVRYLVVKGE